MVYRKIVVCLDCGKEKAMYGRGRCLKCYGKKMRDDKKKTKTTSLEKVKRVKKKAIPQSLQQMSGTHFVEAFNEIVKEMRL